MATIAYLDASILVALALGLGDRPYAGAVRMLDAARRAKCRVITTRSPSWRPSERSAGGPRRATGVGREATRRESAWTGSCAMLSRACLIL